MVLGLTTLMGNVRPLFRLLPCLLTSTMEFIQKHKSLPLFLSLSLCLFVCMSVIAILEELTMRDHPACVTGGTYMWCRMWICDVSYREALCVSILICTSISHSIKYRVFIKYCIFEDFFYIFSTLVPTVYVCTVHVRHFYIRQSPGDLSSRVQKITTF